MARQIDADEFMKEIRKWLGNETDFRSLQEIIAGMPTIDTVKQEWIRAKDRLPKKDEEVLVYWDDGFEIGRYVGGEVGENVYWMPLPEPPKEGE